MNVFSCVARARLLKLATAALVFAAFPLGCGTNSDHPAQLNPIQSGSGATVGATGATSTSASTGGSVEVCECVAAIDESPVCAQCVYDAVFLGDKPCDAEALLCNQDPGCLGMLTCLSGCHSPCCIDACLVGATGADALPNFQAVYACTCGHCAAECAYPTQIQCVADGEQGGTDGCGGEGGAGGSSAGSGGAGGA